MTTTARRLLNWRHDDDDRTMTMAMMMMMMTMTTFQVDLGVYKGPKDPKAPLGPLLTVFIKLLFKDSGGAAPPAMAGHGPG